MKRKAHITVTIVWFLMVLFSCQGDDEHLTFNKNPDERLSELLKMYRTDLVSAPHGWKVLYFPDTSRLGGYNFMMKFDERDRVHMIGDLSTQEAKGSDGIYKVMSTASPELNFASHSLITELANPTIVQTEARGGENEFCFVRESKEGDTLFLKGRKRGADFVLIKAQSEDWRKIDSYSAMVNLLAQSSVYSSVKYASSDEKCESELDLSTRSVELNCETKSGISATFHGIGFTESGIILNPPIKHNGKSYGELLLDGKHRFVDNLDNPEVILSSEAEPVFRRDDYLDLNKPSHYYCFPSYDSKYNSAHFKRLVKELNNKLTHYQYQLNFAEINTHDNSIDYTIKDMNDGKKYLVCRILFDMQIKDGKVFLTQTGAKGIKSTIELFKPLTDFLTNPEGLFIRHTGKFLNFPNEAYTFTSAQDPSLRMMTVIIN